MFESFSFKKTPERAPERASEHALERAPADNEDTLLETQIEEIHLANLEIDDLRKIEDTSLLVEEILNRDPETVAKFQERVAEFLEEAAGAYTDEELQTAALVHLLRGTPIPPTAEHLDLEGEYSVQEFLQQISNELSEGTF